jgi:hypothetical protein
MPPQVTCTACGVLRDLRDIYPIDVLDCAGPYVYASLKVKKDIDDRRRSRA